LAAHSTDIVEYISAAEMLLFMTDNNLRDCGRVACGRGPTCLS